MKENKELYKLDDEQELKFFDKTEDLLFELPDVGGVRYNS